MSKGIRLMKVSERLEMRLLGSPDPERDDGYTMYPNWQLRMEIADVKVLEAKLEAMERDAAAWETDRKRLRKLGDLLWLMDGTGERAYGIHAPEDAAVESLCQAVGYGAVMDAAARLWYLRDPIGAFVVGPCAGTVVDTVLIYAGYDPDKAAGEAAEVARKAIAAAQEKQRG